MTRVVLLTKLWLGHVEGCQACSAWWLSAGRLAEAMQCGRGRGIRIQLDNALDVDMPAGNDNEIEVCPDCGAVGYGNSTCVTCHLNWPWHTGCPLCQALRDQATPRGLRFDPNRFGDDA